MFKLTTEHNEEEEEINYVHKVVAKYMKGKDGERRAAELKGTREEGRARKTNIPTAATGLKAAIHEWAMALLGIPHQSSSPSASTSNFTVRKHLEHQLPAAATNREVQEWSNYDAMRKKFIDDKVKEEMACHLPGTPKASEKTKHNLKINIIKRCTQTYDDTHKPPVFKSRLAFATASVVT